ncbi:MAG: hypothetical protein FWD18_02820 [Micrococcales bacterium]|nr:hypothetical protein [Micrococcales bacterium]
MLRLSLPYRPLYFLSALGAGGLSVSVFMYFMFLLPHPETPIPTYEDLTRALSTGSPLVQGLVVAGIVAIAILATLHVVLMVLMLRSHARFTRTDAYRDLRGSNGEVTLMAVPLALAMSINVLFVLGALGVPGLWANVESLFPFSVAAFAAVGVYALVVFGRYLGRIMSTGEFDAEDTNHFAQVLPSFAFAMVAVGLAGPGAMSQNLITSALGIIGALFFSAASIMWALVKMPVSVGMILRKGMATEAGPTLWIGIPILTLLGITFVRVGSGISHNFLGTDLSAPLVLVVLGLLVSAQVLMGLIGWKVMRRQRYFADYVLGEKKSIAAYGLVCPGVAFFVLGMFFVTWGLVRTGVVEHLSAPHLTLVALLAVVQVATVALMIRLNRSLLSGPAEPTPAPAVETKKEALV